MLWFPDSKKCYTQLNGMKKRGFSPREFSKDRKDYCYTKRSKPDCPARSLPEPWLIQNYSSSCHYVFSKCLQDLKKKKILPASFTFHGKQCKIQIWLLPFGLWQVITWVHFPKYIRGISIFRLTGLLWEFLQMKCQNSPCQTAGFWHLSISCTLAYF